MPAHDPVVAIALLTNADIRVFGGALRRVYPLAQIGGFDDLLNAIDEADGAKLPDHDRTASRQMPGP